MQASVIPKTDHVLTSRSMQKTSKQQQQQQQQQQQPPPPE